jgi:hypothetical protein
MKKKIDSASAEPIEVVILPAKKPQANDIDDYDEPTPKARGVKSRKPAAAPRTASRTAAAKTGTSKTGATRPSASKPSASRKPAAKFAAPKAAVAKAKKPADHKKKKAVEEPIEAEAAIELILKPIAEPALKSVAKSVVKPVAKPVAKSAAKPTVKAIVEPVIEAVEEPVVITKVAKVAKRAAKPVPAPVVEEDDDEAGEFEAELLAGDDEEEEEIDEESEIDEETDGEDEDEEPAERANRPEPKLERLQKILSKAGISSRRHAEEMITSGRVQVNGQVITTLGAKADADQDHIRVDGKMLSGAERHRYFMLNKPKGFVTTASDPEGRPTVMQFFEKTGERLYPVGRLDYLSEGLLLVTNDGDLANQLTRAGSAVEKTYLVKVAGQPTED